MKSITEHMRKTAEIITAAKTVKVMNAFSINMLPEKLAEGSEAHTVEFRPVSTAKAKELVKSDTESFIGHEDTAAILSDLLEKDIPMHRGFAKLNIGETALVAQFGQRLPEGTKKLPEGAKLNFFQVTVK